MEFRHQRYWQYGGHSDTNKHSTSFTKVHDRPGTELRECQACDHASHDHSVRVQTQIAGCWAVLFSLLPGPCCPLPNRDKIGDVDEQLKDRF